MTCDIVVVLQIGPGMFVLDMLVSVWTDYEFLIKMNQDSAGKLLKLYILTHLCILNIYEKVFNVVVFKPILTSDDYEYMKHINE